MTQPCGILLHVCLYKYVCTSICGSIKKHCMILSYVIPFHFILFLFHHTLLNNFPFFSFTVYVILCYAILFHFIPSLLYSIASYSTLMICCDIISYAKLRGCTPKKIGTSPRATRATTKQPQCSAVFLTWKILFFRKAWKQTLIEATFTWFVYKMLRQSRKISNKKKDFPHCIESEFGAETFWGHHQLTNGMQSGWHSCMLTSSMLIHVLNPWICPSLAKQSDVHLTEINSASSKRSRRPKNGWTQRSQTQQPIVCVWPSWKVRFLFIATAGPPANLTKPFPDCWTEKSCAFQRVCRSWAVLPIHPSVLYMHQPSMPPQHQARHPQAVAKSENRPLLSTAKLVQKCHSKFFPVHDDWFWIWHLPFTSVFG